MNVTRTRRRADALRLVAAVLLVNLVGAAPAALGGPNSAWFQSLTEPAIYPPPWLFGVVWTLLFTLLGGALFLVWRAERTRRRRLALALFVGQMALNVAWTPVFFRAQDLGAALAVVLALLVVLLPTVWAFDRVDRRAALLLVPYVGWVAFASVLNYRFLVVN
ncbi:TspO/MBR family protein [Haloarcula litorea]|uniref:TspO/MBR family protein n=1 Tax=Haloarcula litorea TaxID=3032579 RepID=UPI0023E83418|nr:TspO/MBR family protein [Halomicroarcula sp. GDY20]